MKITPKMATQILSNQYENFTNRPVPQDLESIKTLEQMEAAMPEFGSAVQIKEQPKANKGRSILIDPLLHK